MASQHVTFAAPGAKSVAPVEERQSAPSTPAVFPALSEAFATSLFVAKVSPEQVASMSPQYEQICSRFPLHVDVLGDDDLPMRVHLERFALYVAFPSFPFTVSWPPQANEVREAKKISICLRLALRSTSLEPYLRPPICEAQVRFSSLVLSCEEYMGHTDYIPKIGSTPLVTYLEAVTMFSHLINPTTNAIHIISNDDDSDDESYLSDELPEIENVTPPPEAKFIVSADSKEEFDASDLLSDKPNLVLTDFLRSGFPGVSDQVPGRMPNDTRSYGNLTATTSDDDGSNQHDYQPPYVLTDFSQDPMDYFKGLSTSQFSLAVEYYAFLSSKSTFGSFFASSIVDTIMNPIVLQLVGLEPGPILARIFHYIKSRRTQTVPDAVDRSIAALSARRIAVHMMGRVPRPSQSEFSGYSMSGKFSLTTNSTLTKFVSMLITKALVESYVRVEDMFEAKQKFLLNPDFRRSDLIHALRPIPVSIQRVLQDAEYLRYYRNFEVHYKYAIRLFTDYYCSRYTSLKFGPQALSLNHGPADSLIAIMREPLFEGTYIGYYFKPVLYKPPEVVEQGFGEIEEQALGDYVPFAGLATRLSDFARKAEELYLSPEAVAGIVREGVTRPVIEELRQSSQVLGERVGAVADEVSETARKTSGLVDLVQGIVQTFRRALPFMIPLALAYFVHVLSARENRLTRIVILVLCAFAGYYGMTELVEAVQIETRRRQRNAEQLFGQELSEQEDVEEQGAPEILFLTLKAATAMLVMQGFNISVESLKITLAKYGSFSRGIDALFTDVISMLAEIASYCSQYLPVSVTKLFVSGDDIKGFIENAHSFTVEYAARKVPFTPQSQARIEAIIEVGKQLLSGIKATNTGTTIMLKNFLDKMLKIQTEFVAILGGMRVSARPVIVTFLGEAGQGKTLANLMLHELWIQKYFKDDPLSLEIYKARAAEFVHTRIGDKFWEGVTPRTLIVNFDDFASETTARGIQPNPWSDIIKLGNEQPFSPTMAFDKAAFMLKPTLVTITTNMANLANECINNSEAFGRRMDLILKVRKVKETDGEKYAIDASSFTLCTVVGTNINETPFTVTLEEVFCLAWQQHRSYVMFAEGMSRDTTELATEIIEKVDNYDPKRLDQLIEQSRIARGQRANVHFGEQGQSFDSISLMPGSLGVVEQAFGDELPITDGQVHQNDLLDDEPPRVMRALRGAQGRNDPRMVQITRLVNAAALRELLSAHSSNEIPMVLSTWRSSVSRAWDELYLKTIQDKISQPEYRLVKLIHPDQPHEVQDEMSTWFVLDSGEEEPLVNRANRRSIVNMDDFTRRWERLTFARWQTRRYGNLLLRGFCILQRFSDLCKMSDMSDEELVSFILSLDADDVAYLTSLGARDYALRVGLKSFMDSDLVFNAKLLAESFKNQAYAVASSISEFVKAHKVMIGVVAGVIATVVFGLTRSRIEDLEEQSESDLRHASRSVRTTKQPRVSVGDRLRKFKGFLPEGTQQGYGDIDQRVDMYRDALVELWTKTARGTYVQQGYAIGVCDKSILTNQHFIDNALAAADSAIEDGAEVASAFGIRLVWKNHTIDIGADDFILAAEDPDRDCVVLTLKRTPVQFKDIVKHFMPESESISQYVARWGITGGALITPKAYMTFTHGTSVSSMVINPTSAIKARVRKELLLYPLSTTKGMCGLPVIATSGSFGGLIYGIHMAGDGKAVNGHGYSNRVTQEWIANAVGKTMVPKVRGVLKDLDLNPGTVIEAQDGDDFFADHPGIDIISRVNGTPSNMYITNDIIRYEGEGIEPQQPITLPSDTHPRLYVKGRSTYEEVQADGIDFDRLYVIRKHLTRKFLEFAPNVTIRVLTLDEAIRGIPGSSLRPLDQSTSPGYPHTALGHTKRDFFSYEADGSVVLGKQWPALHARLETQLQMLRNGIMPLFVFQDVAKSERRKIQKVLDGKTRLVFAGPIELLILFRYLFGAAQMVLKDGAPFNCSMVGINPAGDSWNLVAHRLKSIGGGQYCGSGDFAGFDGHQDKRVLREALYVMRDMYGEDGFRTARNTIIDSVTESFHVFGPIFEQWHSNLASGFPGTTDTNCITNIMMHIYHYVEINGGSYTFIPKFWNEVALQVLGDDNLFSVSERIKDLYTEATFAETAKIFGHVYTSADKTEPHRENTPLENHTILKRSFFKHPDLGKYVGPLDLPTAIERVLWTKKDKLYHQVARNNLNDTLLDLSLHGREVFEEWKPKIEQWYGSQAVSDYFVYDIALAKATSMEFEL